MTDTFSGRARFAQPALVNGAVGAVWAPGGRPRVVFGYTITRGKIVEIDVVANPERLRQLTWRSSTTDEPTYVWRLRRSSRRSRDDANLDAR